MTADGVTPNFLAAPARLPASRIVSRNLMSIGSFIFNNSRYKDFSDGHGRRVTYTMFGLNDANNIENEPNSRVESTAPRSQLEMYRSLAPEKFSRSTPHGFFLTGHN